MTFASEFQGDAGGSEATDVERLAQTGGSAGLGLLAAGLVAGGAGLMAAGEREDEDEDGEGEASDG